MGGGYHPVRQLVSSMMESVEEEDEGSKISFPGQGGYGLSTTLHVSSDIAVHYHLKR